MLILPESVKTMFNAFMAIFAKKEDVKQSDWNQTDESRMDYIKNKPEEGTSADAVALLAELGVVDPVTDEAGIFYTDETGAIYTI